MTEETVRTRSFTDVGVWKKAHLWVLAVYRFIEECRYYLILANDLDYGDTRQLMIDLEEVSRMLDAYMRTMTRSTRPVLATDA